MITYIQVCSLRLRFEWQPTLEAEVLWVFDQVFLDVNGGEKILLRLRPAWAPDTFYEEDNVVRTMLHEASSAFYMPEIYILIERSS